MSVTEDGDLVIVEGNHVEIQNKRSDAISQPLMCVGNVLREAEDIVTDKGAPRAQPLEGSEVLIDEVNVEYSPHHSSYPIEIVVRHNTVVSESRCNEDEQSESSSLLHSNVHNYVHDIKDSSSSSNMGSTSRDSYSVSDNKRARGRKYKWGHRRAFSMPNSNGNRMSLSVIDDDEEMDDGLHKRHVVKYRIRHPSNRRLDMNSVLDGAADDLIEIKLPELAFVGHDDNELEIEINEEEVIHPPGTSDSTKNVRTVVKRFWEARWKVTNFEFLPEWLQDNEYLRTGHRPPLSSFSSCFKSIFSLHTETGNIWTHMYGCVAFIGVAFWFLFQPSSLIQWQEKLVFSSFFIGAISCLGLSFAFHTVQCHSPGVGKLFSKLDYTGISFLIIGSFIPWIYYGFACRPQPMIVYMSMIVILGLAAIIVSLWDKFAEPKFRPLRAGVFVAMGLSSIVPAIHFLVTDGLKVLIEEASLLWLLLMGVLYLTGAGIYTSRVPERWFPGKCDLWFQSHQLFHMFVVAAAFVHFHGITLVAKKRLEQGSCSEQLLERYGIEGYSSYVGGWFGLDTL